MGSTPALWQVGLDSGSLGSSAQNPVVSYGSWPQRSGVRVTADAEVPPGVSSLLSAEARP